MLIQAALAMGLVMAVVGLRQGLYSIWAVMVNAFVSIYLGVMLSPTLATFFGMFGSGWDDPSKTTFWYVYAGCVAAVTVGSFFFLQIMALTYFTGTFTITLPRLVNTVGSLLLGFITGYVLWAFICFVVVIIPPSNFILTRAFVADGMGRRIGEPVITKVVNTCGVFSLQADSDKVRRVVTWTLPPLPQQPPKQD